VRAAPGGDRGWGLSDVRALGGGNVALVFAASMGGRPVVLKVSPRAEEQLRVAAAALDFWRDTGAVVELLGARDDGYTLLMERLGEDLDSTGVAWEERLRVLGALARRLHVRTPPPLPHIGVYGASWRRTLTGADRAELEALLAPRDGDVLIHADLHGGNALRAGEGWKVIDPHAVRGDRHADVWALIDPLAPPVPDRATAWEWVRIYADAAGLEVQRAAAWARLRALAGARGSNQDFPEWSRRGLRFAEALGAG
jgi:streptomycin 6-kinase